MVLSILDTFVLEYISDGSGMWIRTLVTLGNPKRGELMFILPKKDAVGFEPSLNEGIAGEVERFVVMVIGFHGCEWCVWLEKKDHVSQRQVDIPADKELLQQLVILVVTKNCYGN